MVVKRFDNKGNNKAKLYNDIIKSAIPLKGFLHNKLELLKHFVHVDNTQFLLVFINCAHCVKVTKAQMAKVSQVSSG